MGGGGGERADKFICNNVSTRASLLMMGGGREGVALVDIGGDYCGVYFNL